MAELQSSDDYFILLAQTMGASGIRQMQAKFDGFGRDGFSFACR